MRLVLRRYNDAKRLTNDPWYVPAHEDLALKLLESTPVPGPHLYATDFDRVVCDVPALLESWVPGHPEWQPDDVDRYLVRAAEVLGSNLLIGKKLFLIAPIKGKSGSTIHQHL